MNRDISLKTVILCILGILLISAFSFQIGRMVERRTNPVCTAISEDSDISGCDYRNGAWYRK